jgi:hypothetical protein
MKDYNKVKDVLKTKGYDFENITDVELRTIYDTVEAAKDELAIDITKEFLLENDFEKVAEDQYVKGVICVTLGLMPYVYIGTYWSTDTRAYSADVVYEHELLQLDKFMNNN